MKLEEQVSLHIDIQDTYQAWNSKGRLLIKRAFKEYLKKYQILITGKLDTEWYLRAHSEL